MPFQKMNSVMLQLGHGDEAVETKNTGWTASTTIPRFNWATAMKPWRRKANPVVTLTSVGFNWATAMKPWRHRCRMVRTL